LIRMRPGLLPYFLRQAIVSIKRNKIVHLIGLGTMVVSMLVFGTFLLLFINVNMWFHDLTPPLTMSVYLKDGITPDLKKQIESSIVRIPGAKIDRFISKKDALNDLRKGLGPDAALLNGLSRNPLPASFEVHIILKGRHKPDIRKLEKLFQGLKGVEDVQCSAVQYKKIEGLFNVALRIGIIIGGLLCIGSVFVVTNTMKLSIYSRKDEIDILKLVGATDWFVKMPFLLEGLIQGVLSGILTLIFLYGFYLMLYTEKAFFLDFAMLRFVFLPVRYAVAFFCLNVVVGLLGSFVAIGRFFDKDHVVALS